MCHKEKQVSTECCWELWTNFTVRKLNCKWLAQDQVICNWAAAKLGTNVWVFTASVLNYIKVMGTWLFQIQLPGYLMPAMTVLKQCMKKNAKFSLCSLLHTPDWEAHPYAPLTAHGGGHWPAVFFPQPAEDSSHLSSSSKLCLRNFLFGFSGQRKPRFWW